MFGKVWFIFWCLIALFILIPITNTVVLDWTSANGTLAQTFNASNASSWNATGNILTSTQVARVGMTPFEQAVTVLYVPSMIVFFLVIIWYVISRWNSNSRGQ